MGRKGECYIMANENLSYKSFNELVADSFNIKPPKWFIPTPFILLFGFLSQTWAQLTKTTPKVSLAVARLSLITNYYTSAKAIKELDMPQTPIKLAVEEAFEWFKQNDYLKVK